MQIENFNQEALLKELSSCFDGQELEKLAFASKFISRKSSRLTGLSFLMMNVFDIADCSDGRERSLDDSCDWLAEHFDISITKQSLHERYNTYAVSFMRSCFLKVLQIVNDSVVDRSMSLPFSKIQITDATSFKIGDHLSTFYKGWQGQESMIKMHLNYNFINGAIEDIFLTDGISNDNNYKLGSQEEIVSKALYMRDLGYFDLRQFKKLDQAGAYFLSRAKTGCSYYKKNELGQFQKIDIMDYLPALGKAKSLDQIYVGCKKDKLAIRLILQAVPEQVAQQRLGKLKIYASKQPDKKISQHRKAMCYFNVFITNVAEEMLPTDMGRMLYTIRWQIELLFKIGKSIFKIDKVKNINIFRFECYIYSKLIAMILTLHIQNKLGQFLWEQEEFELSPIKAARLVKKNGMD